MTWQTMWNELKPAVETLFIVFDGFIAGYIIRGLHDRKDKEQTEIDNFLNDRP